MTLSLTSLLVLLLAVSSQFSVSQGRPSVQEHEQQQQDLMDFSSRNNKNSNYKTSQLLLENDDDDEEPMDFHMELKRKFLADMGFEQVPNYAIQPRNISQEEYLRAYTEYMTNVRERRRRERGEDESKHPKIRRKQAGIFVETIQSTVVPNSSDDAGSEDFTETPKVIEQGRLRFVLNLGKFYEKKFRLQVRDAVLFLPKNCLALNLVNNNGSERSMINEDSENSAAVVDLTRNVSRLVTRNGGGQQRRDGEQQEQQVILEVEVNCWRNKNQGKGEKEQNDEEGSLKIVWMKTRMGGSDNEIRSRSTRSVTPGFGMVERSHNSIIKHQHQRHRLSDFVDDQTLTENVASNSGSGRVGAVGKRGRRKHGRDCGQTKHGKTCCRKPLMVSFEDLKITDVILAPSRFNMDYCEGRCNANARRLPYASNHAMFQHILNRSKGKEHAPKLCCTPTKLSEIDVIQMDPNSPDSLKVTVIRNARVEECGCS